MKIVTTRNKEELLLEILPKAKLSSQRRCRFCDTIFIVLETKVYISDNKDIKLCCPNAPLCKGTSENWSTIIFR